ncbi:hypothetical protein EVAR_24392_1 [Eumeta japonica]|uniref:Uncharacterized protein n=1 Tax=Eumeta variegata TaxID=151549 RepID=A0A4C1VUE8_EUMVA|nr:hypothetical protein EVAR_24392_1 [Eumeta japonica]
MAMKSLNRLGLAVGVWSCVFFRIITTKFPAKLKTRFEQEYGSDPQVLPTFDQLVEFSKRNAGALTTFHEIYGHCATMQVVRWHITGERASVLGRPDFLYNCGGN